MKTSGILTLVPTPLSEDGILEPVAFARLNFAALEESDNSVFVIEDLKPGRRRWLHFGLPRQAVENFVLYNEHTCLEASKSLLSELQKGKNVFLMSDGGLPSFYDPGIELVKMCHQNKIKVTSTPFCNSVVLALALSGCSHKKFWFEGFLPLDSAQREQVIKKLLNQKETSVLMDTPYRLKRVLEEFQSAFAANSGIKRKLFVALDLNGAKEELHLGSPAELLGRIIDFKREFILIVSE